MNIFRFRAECLHDVNQFRKICPDWIKITLVEEYDEVTYIDQTVEVQTTKSLEDVRNVLRQIEDGHVMVQSIKVADEYDGERNELIS